MTAKKRKGPKLIHFPKPRVDDDTEFVRTLVYVLDQARAGKVMGYAMVFEVDGKTIEAATVLDPDDRHHMLGAIRRMELQYMRRQWAEEDEA